MSAMPHFDPDALARYKSREFQDQRDAALSQRDKIRAALRGEEGKLGEVVQDLQLLKPGQDLNEADTQGQMFDTLERMIGEDDLLPIRFLHEGSQASRAVARLVIQGLTGPDHGTGFLVSPRLLLTNHHVLPTETQAANAEVHFLFEHDADGRMLRPAPVFMLQPEVFFVTHAALDYALVAVAPHDTHAAVPLAQLGHVTLTRAECKNNELMNLIQHPGGAAKRVALRHNRLTAQDATFYQYEADTDRGSSGAPVFNDRWRVVALHHSGVPKVNERKEPLRKDGAPVTLGTPDHLIAWVANEGVRMGAILDHLRAVPGLSAGAAQLRDELLQLVEEKAP